MPTESSIVDSIRRYLKRRYGRRCYVHKNHGSAGSGIPDLTVVAEGRMLWLEAKQPGEKPTHRQIAEHRKLRDAGAEVHTVTSREDVRRILNGEEVVADEG